MLIFYVILVSDKVLILEFFFLNIWNKFDIIFKIGVVVVFGFCVIGDYVVKRFVDVVDIQVFWCY